MIWKPNVTVASIVEIDRKFLMVEEESATGPVLNQPAGHLEPNESMQQAVVRETLEETGYQFMPKAIIGSYLWHNEENETTYFRTTFVGNVDELNVKNELDVGIIRAIWMTHDEILTSQHRLRSPIILESIKDYLSGNQYPLEMIKSYIK